MILLSVSASAQEWATKMFLTMSHDFGVVVRGTKADSPCSECCDADFFNP